MPNSPVVRFDKAAEVVNLMIFDVIGGWGQGGQSIAQELARHQAASAIHVHLNSPGGDVFEGFAIHGLLAQQQAPVEVYIYGKAMSMGSVIAMAGDKVHIRPEATLMIHNPFTLAMGDEHAMEKTKGLLQAIKSVMVDTYQRKTKLTAEEVSALMDKETYMTGAEAVKRGFADSLLDKETPKALALPEAPKPTPTDTKMKEIALALGLAEDATQEQVLAAINKAKEGAANAARTEGVIQGLQASGALTQEEATEFAPLFAANPILAMKLLKGGKAAEKPVEKGLTTPPGGISELLNRQAPHDENDPVVLSKKMEELMSTDQGLAELKALKEKDPARFDLMNNAFKQTFHSK